MKLIYKYQVPLEPRPVVLMPLKAEILSVQMQGPNLCIWAIVEPFWTNDERTFEIVTTGDPLGRSAVDGDYLGTVQDGRYIWHVFEVFQNKEHDDGSSSPNAELEEACFPAPDRGDFYSGLASVAVDAYKSIRS